MLEDVVEILKKKFVKKDFMIYRFVTWKTNYNFFDTSDDLKRIVTFISWRTKLTLVSQAYYIKLQFSDGHKKRYCIKEESCRDSAQVAFLLKCI